MICMKLIELLTLYSLDFSSSARPEWLLIFCLRTVQSINEQTIYLGEIRLYYTSTELLKIVPSLN